MADTTETATTLHDDHSCPHLATVVDLEGRLGRSEDEIGRILAQMDSRAELMAEEHTATRFDVEDLQRRMGESEQCQTAALSGLRQVVAPLVAVGATAQLILEQARPSELNSPGERLAIVFAALNPLGRKVLSDLG